MKKIKDSSLDIRLYRSDFELLQFALSLVSGGKGKKRANVLKNKIGAMGQWDKQNKPSLGAAIILREG